MSKCDEYAPVVNKIAQAAIAGLLILMMAACNVGPNYKRPATSTRRLFAERSPSDIAAPAQADPVSSFDRRRAIGRRFFEDPVLQQLVTEALQNNLDLRVAAQRVLEAQAQAGIVRSQQFPTDQWRSQLHRTADTFFAGGQQLQWHAEQLLFQRWRPHCLGGLEP